MSIEGFLGVSALLAHNRYKKSWSSFESNYNDYRFGTDPHDLLELRPKIVKYAKETERYNAFMKNIRTISLSIWAVNMVHAYLVTPGDDFFDGEYFFDIGYNSNENQLHINFNF